MNFKWLSQLKNFWKWITSSGAKQKYQQVDEAIDAALPVVKKIGSFFGDQKSRKLNEVLDAYSHYNVEVDNWVKALPDDGKYGPALLNLATKVLETIPATSHLPTKQIQAAIQFALLAD